MIQLTSCKRFDNNCYHLQCIANVCNMSVVSFALAVVFIIRLVSTSAFRVPNFNKLMLELTVLLFAVNIKAHGSVSDRATVDVLWSCSRQLSRGKFASASWLVIPS